MLVTIGASDIHTDQIESRCLDVSFFSMSREVTRLLLKILAQAFVLRRGVGDMPRGGPADHAQCFGAFLHLVEFVERNALEHSVHLHEFVTHSAWLLVRSLAVDGLAVWDFPGTEINSVIKIAIADTGKRSFMGVFHLNLGFENDGRRRQLVVLIYPNSR